MSLICYYETSLFRLSTFFYLVYQDRENCCVLVIELIHVHIKLSLLGRFFVDDFYGCLTPCITVIVLNHLELQAAFAFFVIGRS